jgi:hypothetical protein
VFRHNDVAHLEQLLKKVDPDAPKLIVFESVRCVGRFAVAVLFSVRYAFANPSHSVAFATAVSRCRKHSSTS